MAEMTPRTLSGFMELLPRPQQQMERMMDILRRTYSLYGFTPLDTPVIEAADAWQRGEWAAITEPAKRPAVPSILGIANAVTDWIRARADKMEAGR